MRKPGNIFLLAIMLGALCAAMVYRYLSRVQLQLEAVRGSSNRPTSEVVVASEAIPIGSRIEEKQVRVVAWPLDLQPEGALRDPKAAVGNVVRVTVDKNQPIVQSYLAGQNSGLLPVMIAEGMRGMSVRVDEVTGVSGFITPNSRVDVIIAGDPDGSGGEQQRSKVVLQNVKVLATGKFVEQRDEKPVEVPTVTLLVTPEQAERLTLATRFEPVRLALRNYRDESVISTPGVATGALFGERPAALEVQKAEVPTVEVFLGDKLERQPVL